LLLLEEAGYRSVQDLVNEDIDRLAIKSGLGIKKARQVQQGARNFLDNELQTIEEARSRFLAQRAAEQQQAVEGSESEAATEE
jgi:N utilization substance protein A